MVLQGNIVVGMLAHVDAGKTTLSEALLFQSGSLRRLGRVDHQNAFLDTNEMERKRGITIFSKQAVLPLDDSTLTLLDTPGHVDFSTEMERTLQVLDYAILVINASDGVQGHTITLWQLLARYEIPTILFINKMDLPDTNADIILAELKARLDDSCVSFSGQDTAAFHESVAMCGENALSQFLDNACVDDKEISALVRQRLLFPCFFGAALKLEGVNELLEGLRKYTAAQEYPTEFGAKVYKITRDNQGGRLTHLKITGGRLAVRDSVCGRGASTGQDWNEKVNQLRIYSGEKFTVVDEAPAGTICTVTGLSQTYPGQGLGIESASQPPALEPVLSYRLLLPAGCDELGTLLKLRQLEEEDPQLKISWVESRRQIHIHLMGEVQLEILRSVILERFGLEVDFDAGAILYRETIAAAVVGVGHFEPLRHYAEVHLLLEPGERGSGLVFASNCSEDILAGSWQRLVLTHLEEREHPGVLTAAPITDMKISLLTGRAHNKHTEGGDFRQATYRAVRQGLMQAESILLEPWYSFRLEVPSSAVGRAMTDLQRISSDISLPEGDSERTVLSGTAPVAAMRDYAAEVTSYTRGLGRLSCVFSGFAPCHNTGEIIAELGYEPEHDTENPADSVFCSHGAGFTVKWNQVREYAHLDSGVRFKTAAVRPVAVQPSTFNAARQHKVTSFELDEELKNIFEQAYGPIKQRDVGGEHTPRPVRRAEYSPPRQKPAQDEKEYLLVDGYNVIHAWEDLKKVSLTGMDAARKLLMDILSNYKGYREREIILVFDAYKVVEGGGSVSRYHNIDVVYTKEAETADAYIEKVTYEIGKKHRVTVATSDGAVQLIIFGHGAFRISPQMLRAEIEQANADIGSVISSNNLDSFGTSIIIPGM